MHWVGVKEGQIGPTVPQWARRDIRIKVTGPRRFSTRPELLMYLGKVVQWALNSTLSRSLRKRSWGEDTSVCGNSRNAWEHPCMALPRAWAGKLDGALRLCLCPCCSLAALRVGRHRTEVRDPTQPSLLPLHLTSPVVWLSPLGLDTASAIMRLSSCGDLWRSWMAVMATTNSSEQVALYRNGAKSPSGRGEGELQTFPCNYSRHSLLPNYSHAKV